MKSYLTILAVVIFVANALYAGTPEEDKIAALEKEIASLKESIESQQRIIAYLTERLDKAKVKYDPTEAFKEPDPNYSGKIIYRGKERTPEWLDRMYERFADGYRVYNGEVMSLDTLGKIVDIITVKSNEYLSRGSISYLLPRYTVLSVISPTEILIYSSDYNLTHHIHSLGRPYISKERFGGLFVECTGTSDYKTATGAVNTVLSFRVSNSGVSRLKKEDFARGLEHGAIELYNEQKGADGKITKRPIP